MVEFRADDLRVDLKPAEVAEKGVKCSVSIVPENKGEREGDAQRSHDQSGKVPVRFRRGDKIYIWEEVTE